MHYFHKFILALIKPVPSWSC